MTDRVQTPNQRFPYVDGQVIDLPPEQAQQVASEIGGTVADVDIVEPKSTPVVQKLPGVSRLLCLDVGGVLANKDTDDDYQHLAPLDGCKEFLEQLREHGVGTVVNSAHPVEEVQRWLQQYGLYDLISGGAQVGDDPMPKVVQHKPRAEKYLDDRMVRYKGDYEEALDSILDFRPWWADKDYEVDSVALDFDATLNIYGTTGTEDEFTDEPPPPQDGAREFVAKLYSKVGRLVIFSARPPEQIRKWIEKYDFDRHLDAVESYKPKVKVYLDDRGMRFKGDYEKTLEKLRLLEPERKAVAGGVLSTNSPPGNSTATPRVYGEPAVKAVVAVVCPRCAGTGHGTDGRQCDYCGGTGEVQYGDDKGKATQEPRPTYPPPEDFGRSTEPRPPMYANGWATPDVETVDKDGAVQPEMTQMMGDKFGNSPDNLEANALDHANELPDVTANDPGVNAPDLSHDPRGSWVGDRPILAQSKDVTFTADGQKVTGFVESEQDGLAKVRVTAADVQGEYQAGDAVLMPVQKVANGPEGPGPSMLRFSDSPSIVGDIKVAYQEGYRSALEGESPEDNPYTMVGEPYKRPAWSSGWQDGAAGSAPQQKSQGDIPAAYREGYVAGRHGARREDSPYIVGAPWRNAAWTDGWTDAANGEGPRVKVYFPGIPEREPLEGEHPEYSIWGEGGWKSVQVGDRVPVQGRGEKLVVKIDPWEPNPAKLLVTFSDGTKLVMQKQLAGNPNDEAPTGIPTDWNIGPSGPMAEPKRKSLQAVDYVEFPPGLDGLRCQNCSHFKAQCANQPAADSADFNGTGCDTSFDEGFCDHPEVNTTVKSLACCNEYDHPGIVRPWQQKHDKTGSVEHRDDGWWYILPGGRESGPYRSESEARGALGMMQIDWHRSLGKTASFSTERRDDGWWVVGPVGTWNEHGPFDDFAQADAAADRLLNKGGGSGAIFPNDPSGRKPTIGTEPAIPGGGGTY